MDNRFYILQSVRLSKRRLAELSKTIAQLTEQDQHIEQQLKQHEEDLESITRQYAHSELVCLFRFSLRGRGFALTTCIFVL